ncbi:hypothetical protein L3H38_10955, partial [Corynebacterium sp. MC-19]
MPGPANNRWEDSPRSIISGKSGFAHTGSIINNKGGNFVVTHGGSSLEVLGPTRENKLLAVELRE